MWEHLARQTKSIPHASVILFGSEVIEKFSFLGAFEPAKEVLAYRNYTEHSEAGEISLDLDVFAISKFRPELAESMQWREPAVMVVSFDWVRADVWPRQIEELRQLSENHKGLSLSSTTHNFEKIEKTIASMMSLNKDVDTCHQFLRTAALSLGATASAYPLENIPSQSWRSLLLHALKIPLPESEQELPESNFVGQPVIVYASTDSEQKILTLNPDFDYKAAIENSIESKPSIPLPEPEWTPVASSPSMSKQVIDEFSNKSGEPVSTQRLKKVTTGNEDHRVMSDFFTTLAEKSS